MSQAQKPEALQLAEEFEDCEKIGAIPSINDIAKAAKILRTTVDLEATHLRELAAYRTTVENLKAELVQEAARTAEEKLRADQMSQQHDTQAALNREAREQLAALKAAPAAQAVEPAAVATLWVEESGVIDFEVLPPCTLPPGEYSLYTQRAAPAPAAVAGPGGWQPISAAPKSGRTLILGFFNESGKWRTTRGQWFTQEHIDDTWEDADDCKAGWYETPVVGEDCYPVAPTHWMPLPAEPGAAPQAHDVQRDADIQRAVLAERERICAAIKAEDDHCVTQGDYMLDSEDCIKVVRGEWVRPVYEIGGAASAAQGNTHGAQ